MNLFTFVFLGVAMLIVCTFAAPLSEEMQERGERSDMHTREERSDMHTREERSDMHTQGERSEMHTRGENDMQNLERGSEQCQSPWKAVDGLQKCYQYKYSEEVIGYLDATQYCMESKPGARLFTPGSADEMKKVDKAMIPSSVSGNARSYWTGYVEYAWQLANPKGPLLYAANAFPFEPVPEGMWASGQPNDWLPHHEPCTMGGVQLGAPGQIGDTDCFVTGTGWFDGHTILCEFAWTLTPAWNTARRGTNKMHNAQERGQANLMHNAQERGQANLMHNAQERGQATLMHKAQERGQADERRQ